MRAFALAVCLALAASAVAPTSARADDDGDAATPAKKKAEAHYKRARELYQLGRYREAIAQLEAALRFDPKGAELLYNLALVHEKLGEADEAIDGYRKYLKVLGPDGDPEEIKKIKGAVRRLEGAKNELKAREGKRTEHRLTPLSTSLFVAAGLSTVGAVYLGIAAMGEDKRARDYMLTETRDISGRQTLVDSARRDALLADIFGGVAIVSAVVGVTLYLTSEFPKTDNPNEVPKVARLHAAPLAKGGGFLSLEVAF